MSTWEANHQLDPRGHQTQDAAAPVDAADDVVAAPTASAEGDARRDGDELSRLGQVPLAEHPAIFERIHGELQTALADIDDA